MRTSRLQLLAAAGVAVASLALTACQDGTGTRDEGASASQPVASAPSGTSSQAPKESASGSGGNDSTANGSTGNGSGGDASGSGESGGGKGSSAGKGSASGGSDDAPARFNPCNGTNTSVTAQPVSRPVNHMLITVKNTGSKYCDLTYYPVLRFDEMQWVPQPVEDSQPQAVVTLAPASRGTRGSCCRRPTEAARAAPPARSSPSASRTALRTATAAPPRSRPSRPRACTTTAA